jgi:signal transduction histidine kinase/CheY-like chemotaxis protein/CHASE3 domain sensor protein
MDNQIKGEKHIKAKVLLSYAVIVILISSILYFTFSSFQQLTKSTDALARPNQRIALLHDMISSIYHAESNIRSYTLNEQESHLDAYFEELSRINEMVDSLYELSGEDDFFLKNIDSVNIQLLNKTRLLEQFIEIKKQDHSSVFYEKAIDKIIQVTEEPQQAEVIDQSPILHLPVDSLGYSPEEIKEEKNNFFTRLRNFFSGRKSIEQKVDEEIQTEADILARQNIQPVSEDSIISAGRDQEELRHAIESTLTSLNRSRLENLRNLQRMENSILLEDKKVMDRIWEYVTILENYESANAIKVAETAHSTVKKTTEKIFITILFSLVILLAFSWVLIHDVNKSRFYKKQLIQEKEKAEDMVQAKQRFMANISHEIRTPLNSILGFSRQLEKVNLEHEPQTFVNAIHQSSNHLLDIVNDILDFSKIEAGKIELESVPLNLAELVREVCHSLSVIAREKELDFRIDASQMKYPMVLADPLRLRQILINIAGNAIKFTNEGSVQIDLSDELNEADPRMTNIRLRITDTGMGIPLAEQEHVFEEFSRGDHQATRNHKGTGLGLSITKKLVEAMNGRIELFSREGEGSTFTVYLPLVISEEQFTAKKQQVTADQLEILAKILLVDDDKLNHLLLRSLFSPIKGISFFEAENAREGLKLLNDKKFDLIITDMQMPGISGISMVKKIRTDPKAINAFTPVLACTADITPENLRKIEESGIEGYVSKPINETQLLGKIREMLSFAEPGSDSIIPGKAPAEHIQVEKTRKLYDLEGLIAFTSVDPESIVPVIEVFIKDTRINLVKLEGYLKKKNKQGILMVAHKMSNMFGLLKAESAIYYLEKLNRMQESKITNLEIHESVSNLISICKHLIDSLEKDLKEIAPKQYQDNS